MRSGDALPRQQQQVHGQVRAAGGLVLQRHLPQRAAVRAQQQPWGRGAAAGRRRAAAAGRERPPAGARRAGRPQPGGVPVAPGAERMLPAFPPSCSSCGPWEQALGALPTCTAARLQVCQGLLGGRPTCCMCCSYIRLFLIVIVLQLLQPRSGFGCMAGAHGRFQMAALGSCAIGARQSRNQQCCKLGLMLVPCGGSH